MKKVVIMLDGGFVQNRLKDVMRLEKYPNADQIYNFAMTLNEEDEEIFRIFFYHGAPYIGSHVKPISKTLYNFSDNPIVDYANELFNNLAKKNYIALRKGESVFRGWKLKDDAIERLKKSEEIQHQLNDNDFMPEIDQKGVDIRIGLDVAWIASKKIVDRIILVTGDTDFIPAMKFARKEGIQVVLCKIGKREIKDALFEHSDIIRTFIYDDNKWTQEDSNTQEDITFTNNY